MKNGRTRSTHIDVSLQAKYNTLAESRSLLDFYRNSWKGTRLFLLWERYIKYFRRFRFITTVFRIAPWVLLSISTHTFLYLLAAATAILAPLAFLAAISLAASAVIRYKHVNEHMTDKLKGKTVYVLFLQRSAEFGAPRFWQKNARDLAQKNNAAVILVSPFLLSARGLAKQTFYWNVRFEENNIFTVRYHYFFSLQKNVLTRWVRRSILIY